MAFVVIGAQYGDEGKGLMVDYLAATNKNNTVVRFNGGSQAGHTVHTPDNRKHVFSHFGSGTFANAKTHLSRHMIINPVKFRTERAELLSNGCVPKVSVDPRALASIPFDALINQIVEISRGETKHGSCGHGVGETVERAEIGRLPITVNMLPVLCKNDLITIRNNWVWKRLHALGVLTVPDDYLKLLNSDSLLDAYLEDTRMFCKYTTLADDTNLTDSVIFEGAQGLGLDADMGAFPYVTRSNTGLLNVVSLCEEANISDLDVFYMTRIYTTRHGAGPLLHEGDISQYYDVVDETNIPNDWQDSLRLALLDTDQLLDNIQKDLLSVKGRRVLIRPHLVVTCINQMRQNAVMIDSGMRIAVDDIRHFLCCKLGFPVYVSDGKTRDNIDLSAPT